MYMFELNVFYHGINTNSCCVNQTPNKMPLTVFQPWQQSFLDSALGKPCFASVKIKWHNHISFLFMKLCLVIITNYEECAWYCPGLCNAIEWQPRIQRRFVILKLHLGNSYHFYLWEVCQGYIVSAIFSVFCTFWAFLHIVTGYIRTGKNMRGIRR